MGYPYDYGPNGNRIGHVGPDGTTTGEYDDQDRLTRCGDTTYSDNDAGDLAKTEGPEGITTYNDAQVNLRSVELPGRKQIEDVIGDCSRRDPVVTLGLAVAQLLVFCRLIGAWPLSLQMSVAVRHLSVTSLACPGKA